MKQPKRLTREQKEAVAASRLNPNNWMLAGETEFYLKVIHKESGIIRSVDKFRRLEKPLKSMTGRLSMRRTKNEGSRA